MVRRLLAILSALAASILLVGACVAVWLGGRPLAPSAPPPPTAMHDDLGSDLIEPPATAIGGGDPAETARAPSAPPRHLRTVKRTTPPLHNTLNILLVGVDRRPGARRGGRTDTIMVAVVDRGSDHVGIVSVPRDLYVEYPGLGPARVNAAFSIARRTGQDELDLLRRVVSDTLAMPIHHGVAVDLTVFERSVDALGGVVVDVPCPIQDNFLDPRTPSGRRSLDVSAGQRHMGGVTAAMYVRSRHGRSDWDRARRQQAVLLALRDRLRSPAGIARIPSLWEELGATVSTDMTRFDMLRLVRRARRTRPEHVHGFVIGYRHTEQWTTPEGRWVLLPRYDEIDTALGGLFSAPAPGTRPAAAVCPPADVALTRPDRERFRRAVRDRARRTASN